MEPWIWPLLSLVVGIVGGVFGAHLGVKVAIGKLETRMATAEAEIAMLRVEKHAHAGVLTRHEANIVELRRKAGLE